MRAPIDSYFQMLEEASGFPYRPLDLEFGSCVVVHGLLPA